MATKKLKVNGSWTEFLKCMRDLESFTTHGALQGESFPYLIHYVHTGRMDPQSAEQLKNDAEHYGIRYLVTSYGTPIAWKTGSQSMVWQQNDDKYSVTTSKHQGRIFPGVGILIEDVMNRSNVAYSY